jgi:hypothetical protein
MRQEQRAGLGEDETAGSPDEQGDTEAAAENDPCSTAARKYSSWRSVTAALPSRPSLWTPS